ncbi:MAG: prolipoprotein diacylglyceryl transferase [Pseudomonadota bacterium]
MLQHPQIDPVALSIGPVDVHWYGLMYLLAFGLFWLALTHRSRQTGSIWTAEMVSDFLFYGALGVVLGGRIGYVLFYVFSDFVANPLILFKVWEGGMSFHGGMLGVVVAIFWYARKTGLGVFAIADSIAPAVPLGLGAGRMGNFINGELWGRVTDAHWGMVFANAGPDPRHPSQLYQFALEGVALFLVLWFYSARPRPAMAVTGLFLMLYGAFRFIVEFVRQPDSHLGFVAFDWVTMGQILSLPMIIIGATFIALGYRRAAVSA